MCGKPVSGSSQKRNSIVLSFSERLLVNGPCPAAPARIPPEQRHRSEGDADHQEAGDRLAELRCVEADSDVASVCQENGRTDDSQRYRPAPREETGRRYDET